MFKYLITGMLVMATNAQHPKRILMLFADKSAQGLLKQQQQLLLSNKAGLQARDMDIKIYTPKDVSVWKNNHVRNGFTVILIGKDGGEKLRSHKPIPTQKLFGLIDSMPMRKDEMRRSGDEE